MIYLGTWSGLYCVSCEENYTQEHATVKDRNFYCVHGHELITTDEPSYFLRLSVFQKWIDAFFQTQDFLVPANRKTELLKNFIAETLDDLSVSRTKFKWGIQVLSDPDHVIYVWIDALCNYLSALGYLTPDDGLYRKFWADPATKIIHITAKEISRFHAIY